MKNNMAVFCGTVFQQVIIIVLFFMPVISRVSVSVRCPPFFKKKKKKLAKLAMVGTNTLMFRL